MANIQKSCGYRGTFQDSVIKSLQKYCANGTYLSAIQKKGLNKNNTSSFRGNPEKRYLDDYNSYLNNLLEKVNEEGILVEIVKDRNFLSDSPKLAVKYKKDLGAVSVMSLSGDGVRI